MQGDDKSSTPVVHIVDDDPSILRALSRLLRSSGFHVELFSTAEAMLQHRCEFPDSPTCAVIDLELPGLSGLDLQETLRLQSEPLPVIFLTGRSDVPNSLRAKKFEDTSFLSKPACADDLVAAINRALAADTKAREARNQTLKPSDLK